MNQEKLDLHKRLQSVYKEKMGEFKAGDRVYKHATIFGEEIDSQIWTADKLTEIIIVREQSSVKSYWHCTNEKGEERLLTDQDMIEVTCLRLPLPIDPINPERGLWGMIQGHKTLGEGTDCVVYVSNNIEVVGTDPETALLKALCEQEGK